MNVTTSLRLVAGGLLLLGAAACPNTSYTDPQDRETFDADFGRTDLQTFAQHSADSIEGSPALASFHGDTSEPLKVYFGRIQNKTEDHIDTSLIRDKIENELVNSESRSFIVLAGVAGQQEIQQQADFQASGRVLEEEVFARGRQLGADIVIYGSLGGIEKKRGRSIEALGSKTRDVYFLFAIKAVDLESGAILWSENVELSKKERVGFFGGAG